MLTRKTPLKQRTPMKRGTKTLARTTPLQSRSESKPLALARTAMKRKAPKKRPKAERVYAELCHGQECYVRLPFFTEHPRETVVPAHSNSQQDGKGMGIKAADEKTVPACFWCHAEIDQGKRLTKDERRAYWEDGYQRWLPVRARLLPPEAQPQGEV